MAGLFTFSVAGLGFLLIATLESLPPSSTRRPFHFLSISLLSSLFILYFLLSSFFSADPIGPPLPLSSLAVSSLFLLYSLAGLLLSLPPSLLHLLSLFAFFQEFLLFYLRRKDLDGLENRYFDLLLVPILVCAVSTLLAVARPKSSSPRLVRAAGLALHGTWLIQMGFSFFSSIMANGCSLHEMSWANYTIKCKGHAEYHRSSAIATLQFNCHLAFLVVVGIAVYSVVMGRSMSGGALGGGGPRYRPLNKELKRMDHVPSHFTLESDEDEVEIVEEGKHNNAVFPVSETGNGFGGSH